MNRQAESSSPGAHRPAAKAVGPSPNPGRAKLLMLHSDPFYLFLGTGMKGTWYKYPRWLGYGAGGREERRAVALMMNNSKWPFCVICQPSPWTDHMDPASFSPPAAREVLGQPQATDWGNLALA